METIIMPRLGFTMVAGVIEKWHKKVGDKVEKGDILFEVVTDKVTVEVDSLFSGYIRKITGAEGTEIPVNEIIGYIGEKEEEISEDGVTFGLTAGRTATEQNSGPAGSSSERKTERQKKKLFISPLARKTAKEMGIDYESVTINGTGPGGRITKDDIISFADTAKKEPKAASGIDPGGLSVKSSSPLKGMRKVIAERMSYAKKNIPHLVLNARADATALIEIQNKLMDKILSSYKLKVTITDFILKISAIALRDNLKINSSLQDENYIIYEDVNVGFAVAVDEGLIVPTIYKCDRLDLLNIARKRIELVDKAKKGNLSLDEITNGTFTVTNLGMFGVRSFNAIINPPQAAILATGGIYADTAVIDGRIDIRSFLELSLSCDHRIVDGAIGARFLQKIVELIENPEMLFI
jgi:pyruvate dehydrogenase E2 component (dihydrolipoamide acetyltransferase)